MKLTSKFARFESPPITVTANLNLCQIYREIILYVHCRQHVMPRTQVFITKNNELDVL